MVKGFETYNTFKNSIKDIKQLYDLTFHLYLLETDRLKLELPKAKHKVITVHTSVGSISHSLTSLYQRLRNSYPYKLRQLLLISSITSLEVYLTDVINEVFERDITPFKEELPLSFPKNYLLNLSSIHELQDKIMHKDIRNLTSGGLQIIEKYYKKIFNIDFKNIGINYNDIEEIHIRRHLFVHRDGFTDLEYCQKYPTYGYSENQKIKVEHEYLIASLNNLSEFAGLINKVLLEKYPEEIRKPKYSHGSASFDFERTNLMVQLNILNEKFDINAYLNNLIIDGIKIMDYVAQLTIIEKNCFMFMVGNQDEISRFFKHIKANPNLTIDKIIEIKNNAS